MVSELRKEKIIATLKSCDNIGDEANRYYADLIEIRSEFDKDSEKQYIISMFEAFGNSDRFLILDMIRQKDRCVCELEAILAKSQPAVSHHLKILEQCNLIQAIKVGKFSHYSLKKKEFDHFRKLWDEWYKGISNWFGL
ncbi:MAG: ArsR/SmtB family transcription factor [Promethearchaeota archaeon]